MTEVSSQGKAEKDCRAAGQASPAARKKKRLYDVSFYHDWCKACGICMAFCPQQIILAREDGKPSIQDADKCVGCRFCELHCPDFAITVDERKPKRRKSDV